MSTRVFSEVKEWSLSRKAITVFTICYVFLYMFPRPFSEIPGSEVLFSFYNKPMEIAVLWFGKVVLGITKLEKIAITGSGDTTFDYVNMLFLFLLSVLATVLILLVSKKKNFESWFHLTWVYARYYVGLFLILYGVIKFFNGQFQPSRIERLEETFGEASPMGLLWTFMGHSKAYAFFGGFMEFMAGVLLLFRRTTVAGALMGFGVMLNVAAMNYCYDVPVKLFSSHLTLLTLFILSPYLKLLYQFIFKQQSVKLAIAPLVFDKKGLRIGRKVFKYGLLGFCMIAISMMLIEINSASGNGTYTESFNGSYEVSSFIKNGDTLPPLETDSLRWNKVFMEDGDFVVRTMDRKKSFYSVKTDTLKHKVVITSYKDTTEIFQFDYKRLKDKQLQLKGVYKSDTLDLVTKQKTKDEYPLNNRGFHWINDYPFNR